MPTVQPSYRIALAGNPNTGKSTLFNVLTGLRQHTGNWPGKTVLHAEGEYDYKHVTYTLVDLPGTYSLYSNSTDEEVARDCVLFTKPDVTVVVLDATAIERNLNLALQVLEMTDQVVICINLMDEAKKKGIEVDSQALATRLGVPVVPISARNKDGLETLKKNIQQVATGKITTTPYRIRYHDRLEKKIQEMEPEIRLLFGNQFPSRWIALRLIDGDKSLLQALKKHLVTQKKGGDFHGTNQSLYPAEA